MTPRDRTIPERVATLEAEQPFILAKLDDISADVKALRANQQQSKGMAKLGSLLLNVVAAGAGALAGIKWGH